MRYEYTPGFEEIDALAAGGQGHYWFSDRVKLGLTANANDEGDVDSSLYGADVTVRLSTDSWLKVQGAQPKGSCSSVAALRRRRLRVRGLRRRVVRRRRRRRLPRRLSFGLGDFFDARSGRLTLYGQSLDGGLFGARARRRSPTPSNYGGAFGMPHDRAPLAAREGGPPRRRTTGSRQRARARTRLQLNDNWSVGDRRAQRRPQRRLAVVPLTQEQGERTDAVVQLGYDPKAPLERLRVRAGHAVAIDGNREDNGRVGIGGAYRVSRPPGDRRRSLGRRARRRRQARHELPAQRPHDVTSTTRSRTSAPTTAARDARQRAT